MKKKFILLFVLFVSTIFGQTKLLNESIERNKLTLKFRSSSDYRLLKKGSKNIFHSLNFHDESSPGDVRLPSNSLFISLPKIGNPKIVYRILSKKGINAIPEFNDKVDINKEKELIYSEEKSIKNSKKTHFRKKGFLWIDDKYCLHLEVTPAIFISSKNIIEIVHEFEIELVFNSDIASLNNTKKTISSSNTISNNSYIIQKKGNKYKINTNDSWIDYSKQYVKIGTAQDAIYRISKSDLDALNIPISSINPQSFRLLLKGEEIPIFVTGEEDFSFDSNDYIEFVGIRNMEGTHREVSNYDEPYNEYLGRYTDTTVYWLTWAGVDGKRVKISDGTEVSSSDTLEYYSQINHYETNKTFDFSCASLVRRETPFWIENKTWHEEHLNVGIKNKVFSVLDVYPNKNFKMFAKFQDYASNISANAHLFSLGLNSGAWNDSTYIDKYEQVVLETELNSNLLNHGNNTLNINSIQTEAQINACIFDWYEIEYPRYLIPISQQLDFVFPFIENSITSKIKLKDIVSNSFSLWKYGDKYKKYNVAIIDNEIIFTDSISSSDKFTYMSESKIKKPIFYYSKEFTNLRKSDNKADYIAITNKKFKSKVDEYSQFIANSYNLKTKVVDVDDIYDEYSFGFFNPEAIKDFLKSTHEYWQSEKPEYVVLIGGATYDYYGNKFRNISAVDKRVLNFVPSFGASVSDNWFVTWDTTGAYIPQINIGRIPVTTDEELDWYFEKHQNYLSQEYDDWNKKYMFFSGGNPTKTSELNSMRESNQYVIDNYVIPTPIGGKSVHFYKTLDPTTNFGPYSSEYIQNVIDDGAVFISYLGHSGTQTWDNSITNPTQLKNSRNRYPIVSDFGCSTARFAEPDVTSFSQMFTIGNDGQALAYVGNASLGFVSTSLLMPKLFYKKILQENILTVSKAHKEAKIEMLQTYGSTGIYELFSLTNTLIGDPILTLPIPDKPNFVVREGGIHFNSNSLIDLKDSVEVSIQINNYGSVNIDTLVVLTIHQFQTKTDSIYSRLEVPSYSDSVNIKLDIKNKAGNHSLIVIIDPSNKFEEISKDDNIVQTTFNVASSSIRPILQYQIFNGIRDSIIFINPSSEPTEEILLFDIATNELFSNFSSSELSLHSLISSFNINELELEKRFWGRTKVMGDNNYTIPFSFTTFEIKYIINDTLSFNELVLSNIQLDNITLKIDSIKTEFEVLSAGFSDGRTALIMKNGQNLIPENTSRGHHICLFDDVTFELVDYKLYDLYGGGSTVANEYISFLDAIPNNNLVMFAIMDEGAVSLSTSLRTKIKSFGSTLIDQVNWRASWAFIGKRGAIPGSMPEAISFEGGGSAKIDTTISFLSDSGCMLTSEIGPTGNWDKLVVDEEIPSNSSITYSPIGIKTDGTLDTLDRLVFLDTADDVGPYADLSHINSYLYPKIKILADFKASDDKQSPVLKSLGVDYDDVAELAMNYQVVSVEKDSITQGENNKLKFAIWNVGETNADSVSVKIELQKPDNSSIILEEFLTSVDSSSKKKFEYEYEILNSYGFGDMAFSITVDEEEKITEFFKDNNFYQIPFYVRKDTVTSINSAEIDVKFDGFEIINGDFVTSSPQILFELHYSGNFPLEDTSAIRFTLDNKQVYNSQMNIDYDTVNRTVSYSYEPELEDGDHYLRVTENHLLIDDSFGIDKLFTVSNELKAVDIYNFPNPASDVTDFTFRLTKVPEELDIKVYTVAGRLIKTFELQSYDLKADLNKIHWDLRDQDGDKIANGVYLYKIILKDNDKVEHFTQKLAVVR